ncbi:hypothetical protein BT69DRAFT_768225 [Atractiella rhizophila]|nr:hypothetical protein BT69DRAFT_768225 [Atractiella rhizophila]
MPPNTPRYANPSNESANEEDGWSDDPSSSTSPLRTGGTINTTASASMSPGKKKNLNTKSPPGSPTKRRRKVATVRSERTETGVQKGQGMEVTIFVLKTLLPILFSTTMFKLALIFIVTFLLPTWLHTYATFVLCRSSLLLPSTCPTMPPPPHLTLNTSAASRRDSHVSPIPRTLLYTQTAR